MMNTTMIAVAIAMVALKLRFQYHSYATYSNGNRVARLGALFCCKRGTHWFTSCLKQRTTIIQTLLIVLANLKHYSSPSILRLANIIKPLNIIKPITYFQTNNVIPSLLNHYSIIKPLIIISPPLIIRPITLLTIIIPPSTTIIGLDHCVEADFTPMIRLDH